MGERMDKETVLLAALVILAAVRILQARRYHAETMELYNDLATMLGEWFEMWRESTRQSRERDE